MKDSDSDLPTASRRRAACAHSRTRRPQRLRLGRRNRRELRRLGHDHPPRPLGAARTRACFCAPMAARSASAGVRFSTRPSRPSPAVGARMPPPRRRSRATAAGLIGVRELIGLDVGTSTLALAEEIAGRQDVAVFTGSLYAAAVLGRRSCPVHVFGGLVRGARTFGRRLEPDQADPAILRRRNSFSASPA